MSITSQPPMPKSALAKQLLAALDDGDASRVRELLALGADPNTKWSGPQSSTVAWFVGQHAQHQEVEEFSALILAVIQGSEENVKMLLDAGADTRSKLFCDYSQYNALECACCNVRNEVGNTAGESLVKLLAQAGAGLHSDAATLLPDTKPQLVEYLLNFTHGQSALDRLLCNVGRYTVNHVSDAATVLRIASRLLDLGANVNATVEGLTPLNHAASARSLELLAFLIEHGADPHCNAGRSTVIHTACMTFSAKIVRELAKHGVIPSFEDFNEVAASIHTGPGKDATLLAIMEVLHRNGIDPRIVFFDKKQPEATLLTCLVKLDCAHSARFMFEQLGEDIYQKTAAGVPIARLCGPKTKQMLLSMRSATEIDEAFDAGCVPDRMTRQSNQMGML